MGIKCGILPEDSNSNYTETFEAQQMTWGHLTIAQSKLC